MALPTIEFARFSSQVFHLFDEQWLLLTSGDFAAGQFNPMTISWGSLGFMERFDTFTVTAFPERHRRALNVLGSKSGRDGDKLAGVGLTPVAAARVAAPTFAEAELVLECRKLYRSAFDPRHFLDPAIAANYPQKDYHTVYFGEIVVLRGAAKYAAD